MIQTELEAPSGRATTNMDGKSRGVGSVTRQTLDTDRAPVDRASLGDASGAPRGWNEGATSPL